MSGPYANLVHYLAHPANIEREARRDRIYAGTKSFWNNATGLDDSIHVAVSFDWSESVCDNYYRGLNL